MKTFITGAGGFVGLNLVERLLRDGERVAGFSQHPLQQAWSTHFASLPGELTIEVGDVRDPAGIGGALRRHRPDAVVHLAVITSSAARERREAASIVEVNLVGLTNTMMAAAEHEVGRFVYPSSIAVFGPNTSDGGILSEDSAHDPQTLYAITKSAGEHIVARLGDLLQLDWVVGRLGRVFGPYEHDTGVRDTMSQIHQIMTRAREGRRVALARPCIKNWSYAPDTAADISRLMRAPTLGSRVYNLGAPYAWSLEDWCRCLSEIDKSFQFSVGHRAQADDEIDLLGSSDGALLSWRKFEDDFPRDPPHDLAGAFAHYLEATHYSPGRYSYAST